MRLKSYMISNKNKAKNSGKISILQNNSKKTQTNKKVKKAKRNINLKVNQTNVIIMNSKTLRKKMIRENRSVP
jgi:hypothetical protein